MAEVATAPTATKGLMNIDREEALAGSAGQPEWLRELRSRAWTAYEKLPLPTRKLEEWRYTDVAQLKLDEVRLAGDSYDVPAEARALLEGKEASAKVLMVGRQVVEIELDPRWAEKGVIVADLATAAAEHPELVLSLIHI